MSAQLFLLCALMAATNVVNVVVHSFVADSSLLNCCECFFHLMFAGRPPFAFLRWFQLFCLFHLVSAVCLPDYGSHISFAINICGLVFLSLP